jgi:hypothetical protein
MSVDREGNETKQGMRALLFQNKSSMMVKIVAHVQKQGVVFAVKNKMVI